MRGLWCHGKSHAFRLCLLFALAVWGDHLMSAVSSQLPPPSLPELDEFVFHPDQFAKEAIPRRLQPGDVATFLMTRLDASTSLGAFQQAEKLVDFYDLNEVAAYLRRFLDGREAGPDQRKRSIVLARTIARSGAPEDRRFAAGYLNFLVQKATAAEMPGLVSIYEALGPEGDAQPLRAAAGGLLSAGQSPTEARNLQNLLNMTIPRAEQANTMKSRILAIPGRQQRIDGEVKVYLALLVGYPEYLPAWAARRLRRETWGDSPAEQSVRNPDRRRSTEVAEAFRRVIPVVETNKAFDDHVKSLKRVTCLRAIDFFGGTLSTAEYKEMHADPARQFDVLSNL